MKRFREFLEDEMASDGAVFWAFGIAIATGLGFVGAAHAIESHFKWQDCLQTYTLEQCIQILED